MAVLATALLCFFVGYRRRGVRGGLGAALFFLSLPVAILSNRSASAATPSWQLFWATLCGGLVVVDLGASKLAALAASIAAWSLWGPWLACLAPLMIVYDRRARPIERVGAALVLCAAAYSMLRGGEWQVERWVAVWNVAVVSAFPLAALLPVLALPLLRRAGRWYGAAATVIVLGLLRGEDPTCLVAAPLAVGVAELRPLRSLPVAALCMAMLAVFAREWYSTPHEIVDVFFGGTKIASLAAPLALWAGVGAVLAFLLWRFALPFALFALLLGQVDWPRWSRMHSPREVVHAALKSSGPREQLLTLSPPSAAMRRYADFEVVRGIAPLVSAMASERAAIVPRKRRCEVRAALRQRDAYLRVLDDSHASLVAIRSSDRPFGNFARAFATSNPRIGRPLDVVFEGGLALRAVKMPESVERGQKFEMVLVYEVLKRQRGHWKTFVHFDGVHRFQGDHEPIGALCPMHQWTPGEFVIDRFEVEASRSRALPGRHRVWAGFFVGTGGSWTNRKLERGESDEHDRVQIGEIWVR
jgi:hypothetical protein